ncbi:DUF3238 domain-containing protein [Tuberibacillus sp. Marseille-P3662]|uniref:DUF3238 domain-containing protein n=1 Tax=Tuberibacillus sp. Marseille-P3662 TaxID=1965358 RepID=UPI000A1C9ACE|nr:DUF3238 domain-containing protein [Tuberibacillus sp. Marseille-P3662]
MKKLTLLFSLTLLFLGMMFLGSQANAKSNNKPAKIQKGDGKVSFHINVQGDYYKFYQKGKIQHKGKSANWTDELNDSSQKYKIGVYKENKLVDIVKVKVGNGDIRKPTKKKQSFLLQENTNERDPKEQNMEQRVKANTLEVAATHTKVYLQWSELPDKDGYFEVYRDGEKIARTKETRYLDTSAKSGNEYRYKIVAESTVSDDRKRKLNSQLEQSRFELTQEQKKELFTIRGTVSNKVKTPVISETYLNKKGSLLNREQMNKLKKEQSNKISTLAFPGTSQWRNYIFRYTTFIPFESVEDPKPFNGTYLKGDDRNSFDFFANDYRTRTDVWTYFNSASWLGVNAPNITYNKDIQQSVRCEDPDCSQVIERDTASESGIEVIKDTISSNKLQWRVKHDVGIPFGWEYPNINYYYSATLTSTPSLTIEGAHDKAPNHEFFMAVQNSDVVIPLHTYSVGSTWDFFYLTPTAPQEYFNISM